MLHSIFFFPLRTVQGDQFLWLGGRAAPSDVCTRAFELQDELAKPLGWVPASPESPVFVQDGNQNYKSRGSGFVETPGKQLILWGIFFLRPKPCKDAVTPEPCPGMLVLELQGSPLVPFLMPGPCSCVGSPWRGRCCSQELLQLEAGLGGMRPAPRAIRAGLGFSLQSTVPALAADLSPALLSAASEAGGVREAEDRWRAEGPLHSQPHQAGQVSEQRR